MISGAEVGTITTNLWYVPYRNYRLTKIEMFKNGHNTAGFTLTFSPPSSYTGWPDETHTFGNTGETSQYQSITFDNEIVSI